MRDFASRPRSVRGPAPESPVAAAYAAIACLAAVSTVPVAGTAAADLQDRTVTAFNRYVRLTEARMEEEVRGAVPLLYVDRLADDERREVTVKLRRGEIVVHRLRTRDGSQSIDVPQGMYHHWLGTAYVPGVGLDRIVSLMQGYEGYQEMYRPAVQRSRILSRDGDRFKVYLRLFKKKVLSVVLNTEYDVEYVRVAPNKMHVRSYTTRIAEVDDAGTAQEQEKPVGHDNGFLWRFNNYCGIEERDGGTYVQCETVSLSRDVPRGLGWLIGRFVTSIPREELEFTLGALRATSMKAR